MLTRELLSFRLRKGRLYPTAVGGEDAEALALAGDLIAIAREGVGDEAGALQESLRARSEAHSSPWLGRALEKLVLDRVEVEPPDEAAEADRLEACLAATACLRAQPEAVELEVYEAALESALPGGLEPARRRLYADRPERRRVLSLAPLEPRALLERHDLAQVQGLLLHAERLELTIEDPDPARVRRVLRWLRFCRLVAEIGRDGAAVRVVVEGPTAILDMPKKYGLQLAQFVLAVPLLSAWRLEAEVRMPRRKPGRLELGPEAGLVSPLGTAVGHVPEELATIARRFEDPDWTVDPSPEPRPVGVRDLCVPDLGFVRRADGRRVALELFHRWHRGALSARLDALEARPDPDLLLGVDRAILREAALAARVEGDPRVLSFSGFPSVRALRKVLAGLE